MAKLRQELHDFLLEHGFKYEENAECQHSDSMGKFDNVYTHDLMSIFYFSGDVDIRSRNNLKIATSIHMRNFSDITLDLLREVLTDTGIIKPFVPKFRKGDKLVCVDNKGCVNTKQGDIAIALEDSSLDLEQYEHIYVRMNNSNNYFKACRFKKLDETPLSIPNNLNIGTKFEPTQLSDLTEVIFNHLNAQHKAFQISVNHDDNSVSVKLLGE